MTTIIKTNATVTNKSNMTAKAMKLTALDTVKKNFTVKTIDDKLSAKERKAAEKAAKAAKEAAMTLSLKQFVGDGAILSQKHKQYHAEFVVRGNKALYELLQDIYAYALRIEQSGMKEAIIDRLRWEIPCSIKSLISLAQFISTPIGVRLSEILTLPYPKCKYVNIRP
jgi:hypothetical protein